MPKRPHGSLLPLQIAPGETGLGLSARIYKTCLEAIVDGRLAPGARLPSARQLATDWTVSRNTIDDAIGRLQADGFLVRRVGDGTFVAADLPVRVRPAQRSRTRPPNAFGRRALAMVSAWGRNTSSAHAPHSGPRPEAFVAGMPALDLFPLELWRRLVARRMRVGGCGLLGYFPIMGHLPLREALVLHLAATRGVAASPEQIMIVNSAMQATDLVTRVLLEPSDSVWVEDPCYPNLRAGLAMTGVRVVPVRVDANGLDVREGVRLAPGAMLACVSPSCQYPTGATLSLDRRLALLRWAERGGAWIIEDDYQCEFVYEGRPIVPICGLDRGERVFYVGTFTNNMFPSLRLAYVVLPQALVPVFEAVRGQQDGHTHGLMQSVLADFVAGGHLSAHLRKMRIAYQSRRDALVAGCAREFEGVAVLGPKTAGMNAALHFDPERPDRDLAAAAQAVGVRVLPLSRYAIRNRVCNGLLLGYAALSERRIASGIARLARAVRAPSR